MHDRHRVLRLLPTRRRLLDPADDLATFIGLKGGELELVGVVRQRSRGDLELLELAGLDRTAGEGHFRYDLGDVLALRRDRVVELPLLHLVGPARLWLHAHERDRMIGREVDLDRRRPGVVFLVGNLEREHRVFALRRVVRGHPDVGEGGRSEGDQHGRGRTDGGEELAGSSHVRCPPVVAHRIRTSVVAVSSWMSLVRALRSSSHRPGSGTSKAEATKCPGPARTRGSFSGPMFCAGSDSSAKKAGTSLTSPSWVSV